MATDESTAVHQDQVDAPPAIEYAFKPHDYGRPEIEHASLPGGAVQRFADKVEAISMGAASILRLIEWDDDRREVHENDPERSAAPVLNNFHRGVLLRMLEVNMDMIASESGRLKDWAFTNHTIEGKTEALADAMRLVRNCEMKSKGLQP